MRAYGWTTDNKKIVAAEARELRKAAKAVARGDSLRSIALDLEDRGVLTSSDKQWSAISLKRALINPRMIGRREGKSGRLVKSDIPPILDEDLYKAVKAILTDPERAKYTPKREAPRLIPSGIVECSRCGELMVYRHRSGEPTYACAPKLQRQGCSIQINASKVNDRVEAGALVRLADWGWRKAIAEAVNGEPEEIGRQIDELKERQRQLGEDFAAGVVSREVMLAGDAKLQQGISRLQQDREIAEAISDIPVPDERKIAAWWADAPMKRRSEVIAAMLDKVVVHPRKGRVHRSDPVIDRVETHWVGES